MAERMNPEKLRQRHAFEDHVRELRDLSPEELMTILATISVGKAKELDEYQKEKNASGLLSAPLPDDFVREFPHEASALVCNTGDYGDDEDTIYEDPLMVELLANRAELTAQDAQAYSEAMRARRSVIMMIETGSRG